MFFFVSVVVKYSDTLTFLLRRKGKETIAYFIQRVRFFANEHFLFCFSLESESTVPTLRSCFVKEEQAVWTEKAHEKRFVRVGLLERLHLNFFCFVNNSIFRYLPSIPFNQEQTMCMYSSGFCCSTIVFLYRYVVLVLQGLHFTPPRPFAMRTKLQVPSNCGPNNFFADQKLNHGPFHKPAVFFPDRCLFVGVRPLWLLEFS